MRSSLFVVKLVSKQRWNRLVQAILPRVQGCRVCSCIRTAEEDFLSSLNFQLPSSALPWVVRWEITSAPTMFLNSFDNGNVLMLNTKKYCNCHGTETIFLRMKKKLVWARLASCIFYIRGQKISTPQHPLQQGWPCGCEGWQEKRWGGNKVLRWSVFDTHCMNYSPHWMPMANAEAKRAESPNLPLFLRKSYARDASLKPGHDYTSHAPFQNTSPCTRIPGNGIISPTATSAA